LGLWDPIPPDLLVQRLAESRQSLPQSLGLCPLILSDLSQLLPRELLQSLYPLPQLSIKRLASLSSLAGHGLPGLCTGAQQSPHRRCQVGLKSLQLLLLGLRLGGSLLSHAGEKLRHRFDPLGHSLHARMLVQGPLRRPALVEALQLPTGLLPLLPDCLLSFPAALLQLGYQSSVLLQTLLPGLTEQTLILGHPLVVGHGPLFPQTHGAPSLLLVFTLTLPPPKGGGFLRSPQKNP
jgi:hypothetical protein